MSELKKLQSNAELLSALGTVRQRRLKKDLNEKVQCLTEHMNVRCSLEAGLMQAEHAEQAASVRLEKTTHSKADTLFMLQQEKALCSDATNHARQQLEEQVALEKEARESLKTATALWLRAQQRDDCLTGYTEQKIQQIRKRVAQSTQREIDDSYRASVQHHD